MAGWLNGWMWKVSTVSSWLTLSLSNCLIQYLKWIHGRKAKWWSSHFFWNKDTTWLVVLTLMERSWPPIYMSMPTPPRLSRLCRPWVSWNGKWRGEGGSKSVWLGWKHGLFFGLPLHFQCVPVRPYTSGFTGSGTWLGFGSSSTGAAKNETLPLPVVIWHIYEGKLSVNCLFKKRTPKEISSWHVDHFLPCFKL